MPYRTNRIDPIWAFIIFWGGLLLWGFWSWIRQRLGSEKQDDNKGTPAVGTVKQECGCQASGRLHDGILAFEQGQHLGSVRRDREAVECFTKAIANGFQDAKVFGLRGTCLHSLKRHQEAIEDFNRAIELDSSDCNNYYMRAMAKVSVEDYIAFEEDMQLAINLARLDNPLNNAYSCGARQQGFPSVEAMYRDTLDMQRTVIASKMSVIYQLPKPPPGSLPTKEEYERTKTKVDTASIRLAAVRSRLAAPTPIDISGMWQMEEEYVGGRTSVLAELFQVGNDVRGVLIITDCPEWRIGFVLKEYVKGVVDGQKIRLDGISYKVVSGTPGEYNLDAWEGCILDHATIEGASADTQSVHGKFTMRRSE